jgi:DNA-binding NarL/FixJ family response regulator
VIEAIAATVPDPSLRDNFLRQAIALLPRARPPSPLQVAKHTFGGLTRREREVTILIAQGKSNQEIANALIVSKRTVETHISNLMVKLSCTSRAQVVVWALENGLPTNAE